ncbi:DUF5906 domain-containing protein [Bacillus cereus]|uniref:DUF5906 domain-containing protein n=1 Tax=Bacillus cereus TaxID=1396 RepID=UPI001CC22E40|nr:DUF5906 domain-containing protein [Bacillus cereus]
MKKLSTGETLNLERKGKDPFDFTNYAKLLIGANKMPRNHDFTDVLGRKLQRISLKVKCKPKDDDYDSCITDKVLSDEFL